MGNNNEVFHSAVIGVAPQDIAFDRRIKSGVLIGHGNIFREQSTVHRSIYENQDTIIGNGNFIMATGHIAHDCAIEDNNVICNGVLLAGHVTVGRHSFISGNVVVFKKKDPQPVPIQYALFPLTSAVLPSAISSLHFL